jgi:glucose-6-phosphate 1-dehydrogenase
MPPIHSDAIVFFGASGDLAHKQIFPALAALIRRGQLNVPIIGVAWSNWSLDQLKARAKDSLEKHGTYDDATFKKLCSLLKYIDGDYRDPATFSKLHEVLANIKYPLFYLAIPPSMFATVAEGLAKSGDVKNSRVVVEKPFGRDLASCQALNRTLHRFFPEECIFRIDHYLGKEPVLNLVYFRFANPLTEAAWDNKHIASVQITMAEDFGVAGRGKFYEETGAVRDVVQNHLLEVIACLGMECPAGKDRSSRRDERSRLLQAVRPLSPSDIVRGQFCGYRKEPGVAPDSQVETYVALRFEIDNDRWRGVPFFVRAGKCLPVTVTEVLVYLKRPTRPVMDDRDPPLPNYYRFRLTPEMVIALGTKVKKAGELMVGERIEMVARYEPPDEMMPYERLLGDAAEGDDTLFSREDSVEAAWRVVDPILGNVTPVIEYEPGSWGPPVTDRNLVPEEGWHNPKASEPKSSLLAAEGGKPHAVPKTAVKPQPAGAVP